MSIEETLSDLLDSKLAPMRRDLERVQTELANLRKSLPPQLVRLKEAARVMGVSTKTAKRRCDAGDWPCRRDGRNTLVDLSALHTVSDEDISRTARKLRALSGGASAKE